jgi:hypothetical protein
MMRRGEGQAFAQASHNRASSHGNRAVAGTASM